MVVTGQPPHRLGGLLGAAVDLGPVAGGDDRGFAYRLAVHQVVQRLGQALGVEGDPLAHLERRSLVVDAEGEQLHADHPAGAPVAVASPGPARAGEAGLQGPDRALKHIW